MRPANRASLASLVAATALAAIYGIRRYLHRVKRKWPLLGVEVRRSHIRAAAGDGGLFASVTAGHRAGRVPGRVLSLLQATRLKDRDYLMGGFGLNAHVDARFA